MLKEIRKIDTMKVFNTCRHEQFYTMGTTEQYSNLLDNLCGGIYNNKKVTLEDIENIALDIYNHSDIEYFESKYNGNWSDFKSGMIEHIAYIILNDCTYSIIEYIEEA